MRCPQKQGFLHKVSQLSDPSAIGLATTGAEIHGIKTIKKRATIIIYKGMFKVVFLQN